MVILLGISQHVTLVVCLPVPQDGVSGPHSWCVRPQARGVCLSVQ
jgi:hypothetical protein